MIQKVREAVRSLCWPQPDAGGAALPGPGRLSFFSLAVGGLLGSALFSLIAGQFFPGVSRPFQIFIKVFVLLFAIIIHEVAHGLAAEKLGDPTARLLGRITLNPIPHIDIFGSIIIPGFLILTGSSFIIGWAKPVPIDIRRFQDPIKGFGITALAGPAANGVQMIVYAVLFRLSLTLGAPPWVLYLCFMGTGINLFLGLFNLIPIPPLDGSRIVAALLPRDAAVNYLRIERFGFLLIFLLLWSRALDPLFHVFGALLRLILS